MIDPRALNPIANAEYFSSVHAAGAMTADEMTAMIVSARLRERWTTRRRARRSADATRDCGMTGTSNQCGDILFLSHDRSMAPPVVSPTRARRRDAAALALARHRAPP